MGCFEIPLKTAPICLNLPNEPTCAIDQRHGQRQSPLMMRMYAPAPKRTPSPVCMAGGAEDGDAASVALGVAGLVAQPVVWASLFSVATSGGGLPAGPFGALGLLEGLSYLTIVALVGASLFSKVQSGSGLSSGFFSPLSLAEGLSFLSLIAGLGVLAYTATSSSCVPNALPIADYSGVVNVCR